ncbi:MAG TPA: L-2-amino-thiazoline-4-carboxylic acid hydrolase [Anaerolineales bacterium]
MSGTANYYLAHRGQLLRQFDGYGKHVRPVLLRYLGEPNLETIMAETRREYQNLLPQLPDIGGKQPFTQFLVFTALWLAVYHVTCARGNTVEEVGELIYEICRAFLHSYPVFLTRLMGGVGFSPRYLLNLQKRAAESRQSKYVDDYIYDFVEADGENFDYGVDYIQCPACKFLTMQGASELAPYLCPVDILYSERLGWGLQRTTTLAEGAPRCDFRFKKGGVTKVRVPAPMHAVVSRGDGS